MKRAAFVVVGSLFIVVGIAHDSDAARGTYESGYKECDLKHLDVCHDTNQLIWGPRAHPVRKSGFDRALKKFLQDAPRIHLMKYSWNAAEVARDSLTGPGDPPVRFPGGEWFFWGFTPHDAPDMGAIILDPAGKILLVATLSAKCCGTAPKNFISNQHVLTIYVHSPEPSTTFIKYAQNWARRGVAGMHNYPGTPKDVFAGTRILTASTKTHRWDERWLDESK